MNRPNRPGLTAGLCLTALLLAGLSVPALAQSEYMPCTAEAEDGPWSMSGTFSNFFGEQTASAGTYLTLPMTVSAPGSGPDVRAAVEAVSLGYSLDRSLDHNTDEDELRLALRTHAAVPAWKGKSFSVRFRVGDKPRGPELTAEMPFEGYSERSQVMKIYDPEVKKALMAKRPVSFSLALPGGAVLDSGEISGFAAMHQRSLDLMEGEIERGTAQQCGQ